VTLSHFWFGQRFPLGPDRGIEGFLLAYPPTSIVESEPFNSLLLARVFPPRGPFEATGARWAVKIVASLFWVESRGLYDPRTTSAGFSSSSFPCKGLIKVCGQSAARSRFPSGTSGASNRSLSVSVLLASSRRPLDGHAPLLGLFAV